MKTKYDKVIVSTYKLNNGEIFTHWNTVEQEELFKKHEEYRKIYPYFPESLFGKSKKKIPTFDEWLKQQENEANKIR
jgi:hypothetical protein